MPKKGKRNYRKKQRVIVKTVPRMLGPTFPRDMIAKHKWTQKFDLVVSGSTEDTISANSYDNIRCYNLYDPAYAATRSGAALFYDDLKAHYAMYQVLGAKIKVTFVNKSAGPIYAGLFRSTDGLSTGWTMTQLREKGQGGKKQRIVGGLNTGREVATFYSNYSLKKTLGVSSKLVKADRDNYIMQDVVTTGTNFPTELWSFYVALVDKNLQTGDANVEAYVEVDFTARWSDREPLADVSS